MTQEKTRAKRVELLSPSGREGRDGGTKRESPLLSQNWENRKLGGCLYSAVTMATVSMSHFYEAAVAIMKQRKKSNVINSVITCNQAGTGFGLSQ